MSIKPLHKYTFGESKNLQVYGNVISEETILLNDDDASGGVNVQESVNWLTNGDGLSKKTDIIPISGNASAVIKLALKIGGSWGDDIQVLFDDFPITINNILIDQIRIECNNGTSTAEVFEVLSFH